MIKVVGAFLAIFAFAVLIETPKKYLWCAGAIGAIGWLVYLLGASFGETMAIFLSAASIALVSHIFARVFKAPVTMFLIPGILPTVPGAGMYRIVYYIIAGDNHMASYYLTHTLEIAGAIAMAIFVVDALFRIRLGIRQKND